MTFYVYIIHNIINNKVYVGKTIDPVKRWTKHLRTASGKRRKEQFYIHRAIAKYGPDNFVFSVLQEFATEAEHNAAETYWIKYFQSKNPEYGYNLTEGGEGVSGRVVSESTRQKMREKAVGRKHTDDTKELLRQINIGKIPTNLEQLKTINIGRELPPEHRQKISQSRKGMIFTEEHRKNMSIVRVGKNIGAENHFYGKTHTEEVKNQSRGENNKRAKLTAENVISMRQEYDTGLFSKQKLAEKYGVSRAQVRRIVSGVDWKHLLRNNT